MKTLIEKREYWRKQARKRRNNPDFVIKEKIYYKQWYEKNGRNRKKDYGNIIQEWRLNHPEILIAWKIYNKALRQHRIKRKKICQTCGDKPQRIYGHHPDYNKPLEVIWLCQSCHKELHAKNPLPR